MDSTQALQLLARCREELAATDVRIIKQSHWSQEHGPEVRVTYEVWATTTPHHTAILRGHDYDELDAAVATEVTLREERNTQ